MTSCSRWLLRHLVLRTGCYLCHGTSRQLHQPKVYAAPLDSMKIVQSRLLHSSSDWRKEAKPPNSGDAASDEQNVSANINSALRLSKNLFDEAAGSTSDQKTFYQLIKTFHEVDKRRRGHLQFIETALQYMKHFNVEKDIEAYNRLLDTFPKGIYVSRNIWQVLFNHFPEQQTVALKVLQKLEDNRLMPNNETKKILLETFGRQSHPVKKYQRLTYWFPKFRNINPFPLPHELPTDPIKLSELSLKRICEYEAELEVIHEFDDSSKVNYNEFITSAQSPDQRDLLSQHQPYKPLYVEGPFNLWLRDIQVGYYILRSDAIYLDSLQSEIEEELFDEELPEKDPMAYQALVEGPVYAMCMTNTGSQERLSRWVKKLQEDNPHLARIPVIFNLFDKGGEDKEAEDGTLTEGKRLLSTDS